VERGVRGVVLSAQYDLECPETLKLIQGGVWPVITVDRRAAIRRVVEYLHASGKRRIAALKRVPQQPLHPFRLGFSAGLEWCHLPFDERSFREYPAGHEAQWGPMIETLWQEVKFDALILCSRELAATAYSVMASKGLNIPDDVAVIAYRDLPESPAFDARLTVFDFPWVDIGGEMVRLFNENAPGSHETRFQAEIVERGSVRKDLASPAPRTRISEGSLNIPVMV
jgi:DNA-binding LacI/PurR family transcriptional regulator